MIDAARRWIGGLPGWNSACRFYETKVIIADACEIMRVGLDCVLRSLPAIQVAAQCADGPETLAAIERVDPVLLLVSLSLSGAGTAELIERGLGVAPRMRVLGLAEIGASELVVRALRAGCHGCLLKPISRGELIKAISGVMVGGGFLSVDAASMVSRFVAAPPANHMPVDEVLSQREKQVLQHVADGKTNKEIAAALNVTVRTIESHRSTVMRKLKLPSTAKLVKFAIRQGIVSLDT